MDWENWAEKVRWKVKGGGKKAQRRAASCGGEVVVGKAFKRREKSKLSLATKPTRTGETDWARPYERT